MLIRHNVANALTRASLRNLIDCTFQFAAGTLASNEVIIGTVLANLDLACYCTVLPLDLSALTALNVDCLLYTSDAADE